VTDAVTTVVKIPAPPERQVYGMNQMLNIVVPMAAGDRASRPPVIAIQA